MKDELMTIQEVAWKYQVSQQTVYNWVEKGLPYTTKRRGIMDIKVVAAEAVEEFLNERRNDDKTTGSKN